MRRALTALLLVLALSLAVSRQAEVEQVAATLGGGNLLWLGLAGLLQLGWLANTALTYQAVYRLLGLRATLAQLLPLCVTSSFVNALAPSGGMGGMAVFVSDARRRGNSAARVTIAGAVFVLCEYISFLAVLALGLIVLIRRNNLTAVELGASGVLLFAALGLAGLLALGASSPPAFERVLLGLARAINRLLQPLLRRPYLAEARAHSFAAETAEGLAALRVHPREYLPALALALLGKALLVGILLLSFLAFGVPYSAGTVVAGFSLAFLFTLVSPTPSGIGVAEGALALGLTSLGVSLGAATLITLAYRGLTFWLPLAYGFAAWRVVQWQWQQHPARRGRLDNLPQ